MFTTPIFHKIRANTTTLQKNKTVWHIVKVEKVILDFEFFNLMVEFFDFKYDDLVKSQNPTAENWWEASNGRNGCAPPIESFSEI